MTTITPGKPVLATPDRRYWRRRANRRVRKARLTRSLLHWSGLLLANAIVAGMLLYAGVRVFQRIVTSEEFALARVEIAGIERGSESAIRARLDRFSGHNLLDLSLHEVRNAAVRDPWFSDVSARRVLPDTLRLTVHERTPRAMALIGGIAHVVDDAGFVVGPSGPGLTDDLPVLTGLDDLEDTQLIAALLRGVEAIGRLDRAAPGWVPAISELDLSREDRVELHTVDPGPRLLLDPAQVERNLRPYLELRRQIERRLGPVDYVDLRWADRISVMPVNNISSVKGG